MAPVRRSNNKLVSNPTAYKPVLKNVMIELSVRHNKACMLCGQKDISEKLYGQLYQLNDVIVHYFCILLSTRAVQNGEDHEGIWGFLLKDIKAELTRGSKENCHYCNKKGATIICGGSKCGKIFHLPCGLMNYSMHQFFQSFKSFCIEHRLSQIIDSSEVHNSISSQCAICKDAVIPSPSFTTLWAPCCKNDAWFHRDCIQDLALSAGYFFKCPLCNNVDNFKSTMLTLGIYIPSRDASWETVPNAYAELSERISICNVDVCLCPNKINKRQFQLTPGVWEILLCNACGSNGTHRFCSSLKVDQEWYCETCKGVTDKNAIKTKKTQLALLDDGNCSGSSVMFEVPSHGEVSRRQNRIMHNRDQPQSSDDPILISDDSNDNIQVISDDESSSTIDVNQPNIQVEQMPRIQLPIISSYRSIRTNVPRHVFSNIFDYLPSTSINLTSDESDDD